MTCPGLILDLCGGSGAWSEPYSKAGYEVQVVDPKVGLPGDVRTFFHLGRPVRGILAAPPCTTFAGSGARWWPDRDDLEQGLALVDACLRIIFMHRPDWWALENPVGRLRRWLGPPAFSFDPVDYGDVYTKRTLLWGNARWPLPKVAPMKPEGVRPGQPNAWYSSVGGKSERAKAHRSATPPGFAQAFYEENP
jgi:hypothetical protein